MDKKGRTAVPSCRSLAVGLTASGLLLPATAYADFGDRPLRQGSRGHDVRVCHDGRSAIDQALDWRPTAAIIDIGLPGISGYGVAQFIRELSFGGDVLLIAVTGYATPADLEMARYAGFNWHFAKPAAPSVILDVLHSPDRKAVTSDDGVLLSPARTRVAGASG